MEAILLTLVLVVAILAGLAVMARGWPSSSRLGGFRAWIGPDSKDRAGLSGERGEQEREDDDETWRWDDDQGRPPG